MIHLAARIVTDLHSSLSSWCMTTVQDEAACSLSVVSLGVDHFRLLARTARLNWGMDGTVQNGCLLASMHVGQWGWMEGRKPAYSQYLGKVQPYSYFLNVVWVTSQEGHDPSPTNFKTVKKASLSLD